MNRIYTCSALLLAVLGLTFLTACGNDDDATPAKVQPAAAGSYTDTRDGQTYGWVRYGRQDWMTDNYRYDAGSESTVYLDTEDYEKNPRSTKHLALYGRLYTLKGAQAACPEGWRLPTDEDWQQLEQQLGMSPSDTRQREWRGRIAHNMLTMKGDTCALNLLLGGYYTAHTIMSMPGWRHMGEMAYYWTVTKDTGKEGEFYFFRKLFYGRNEVCRESTEPDGYQMSVRYVRDAQ